MLFFELSWIRVNNTDLYERMVKTMVELLRKVSYGFGFALGVIVATPVAFCYGLYCACKGIPEEEFRRSLYRLFGIT